MDEKVLQSIGLSQKEVEIYLTLLRHGVLGASQVAEKTGIYRPNVYDNLESLIEKGIVSFLVVDGVKKFKAEEPSILDDFFKEKYERLQKIIPDLEKVSSKKEEAISVTVYRGKHALRKVLENNFNLLKKYGGVHMAMGVDDKKYVEVEPVYFRQFIKLLEENGIKERMISRENETFFAGGKISEYKFIPEEFFNPNPTHIAHDTVSIIFYSKPLYTIVIKNKEVADSYKKYFNMLWKIAKKGQWRKYLSEKRKK